jgi:putative drug exporter of the RND superfamily
VEAGALTRFPRRAAACWILAALVLLPFSGFLDRGATFAGPVRGTESAVAERMLREKFDSPFGNLAILVMSGLPHAADSFDGRADVRTIMTPLLASHATVGSLSPGNSLDTLLVGADKTTAIALVGLNPSVPNAVDSMRLATAAGLRTLRRGGAFPDLALRWTGEEALIGDLRRSGAAAARRSELRALPLTFIVALLAFGSAMSAGLALFAAVLAVGVALGVAGIVSIAFGGSDFTRTLVPLVALALTVDYVLFLQRRGRDGADPVQLRRTVGLAAGVVALGFIGLGLAPTGELRGAAFAGVLACACAALAATTLTSLDGASISPAPQAIDARWIRWGTLVTRRPWITLVVSIAPLLLLSLAATSARLVTSLNELLVPGSESSDAVRELQRVGRGGAAGTLRVVLELPANVPVLSDSGWSALQRATVALRALPGIADVRTISTIGIGDRFVAVNVFPAAVRNAYVSRDGHVASLDVIPDLRGAVADPARSVHAIRAKGGEALTGVAGARAYVAGLPAYAVDYERALRGALPWIVLATSVATLVALLAAWRAPVVAVKAVALNLLVAAAAIGATVLVFQRGIGASLIGQHALGSIFPTVPALAFGAAFGTSMDYELFLIGAVWEARSASSSERDAIVAGLGRAGGLITRAAAVMACLFLAFSTSALLPLAMIGFTLAVAVVLDATLVRLALAPAILTIAGRWNWWPG